MGELLALRRYIERQRFTEALDLIAEMEEMSREASSSMGTSPHES
jgi:hypothetical protein